MYKYIYTHPPYASVASPAVTGRLVKGGLEKEERAHICLYKCKYIYIRICVCMYVCTYVYIHTYIYIHMYVYIHTQMNTYIYIYICMYIPIYIYI